MDRKQLIRDIEQMPESFLDEIHDFIKCLKARILKERMNNTLVSEFSLEKDWLSAEEEAAWRNL